MSNGQLVATVGSIAVGSQATLIVVIEPSIAGTLDQTVTVSTNGANNVNGSASTQVLPATDLVVAISPSASTTNTDADFEYVVSVTNNGPNNATGVQLSDELPAGVTFNSATSPSGLIPSYANGVVTLAIDLLSAGATATMTIDVTPTAPPGSTLVDSATAVGSQADPGANNSTSVSTPVVGVSDLGISVAAQPAEVYVGEDITYTVTAFNQGPNDEPDAVVAFDLPAGVSYDSASYEAGWSPTLALGILTANLGPLDVGASAVVTIVVDPLAAAAGVLTTSFAIQGQNTDPVMTNNQATASVMVDPAADLEVAISPGATPAAVEAQWNYTLTVTNLGLSTATGVNVTAPLPVGVQYAGASSSQGSTPLMLAGRSPPILGPLPRAQRPPSQ